MNHNLFTHPNEIVVNIEDDNYSIKSINEADTILQVLSTLNYNEVEILKKLKYQLLNSKFIREKEKSDTLQKLELYLNQNSYLRTTN